MAWEVSPSTATMLGVTLLLEAGSYVGSRAATGLVISFVPAVASRGLDSASGEGLVKATAALAALLFTRQMFLQAIPFLASILGRKLNESLRAKLMQAVLASASIEHLDDSKVADRISQAGGITTGRYTPAEALQSLAGVFTTRLPALAFGVVLAVFHWWLAVILFIFWQFTRNELLREQRNQVEGLFGQPASLRRSEYFFDLATTGIAAKESRVYGLQEWLVDRFRLSWMASMTQLWEQRKGGLKRIHIAGLLILLAYFGAFSLVVRESVTGQISLAQLVFLVQALVGMIFIGTLGTDEWRVDFGVLSILPILSLERDLATQRKAIPALERLSLDAALPEREIAFKEVSFAYPGSTAPCLSRLELSIQIGQSLALVGVNGAGKTTLVKLLCQLYAPTGGSILIDGVELANIDPSSWRKRIAVVFQDFMKFQMSLKDNVTFGNLENHDERTFSEACRLSSLTDLVERLPNGPETILSSAFSGGVDLSGGEWQKVALARALFAVLSGAKLLILDEPTAHLDVRAEERFFAHLLELSQSLTTTIIISHRYSTVRRADRICVLGNGRIIEDGTHQELMRLGRSYADAFDLQASKYKSSLESVSRDI